MGHDAVRVVRVTHRLKLRLDRREVTRLAARGVERGGIARGEAEEVQWGLRRYREMGRWSEDGVPNSARRVAVDGVNLGFDSGVSLTACASSSAAAAAKVRCVCGGRGEAPEVSVGLWQGGSGQKSRVRSGRMTRPTGVRERAWGLTATPAAG